MTARILIIEDEAVVAMELGFLLEDLGHEVVGFATDSRSALTHAERGGLDLALVGFGGGVERKRWLLAHEGALLL